MKIALVVFFLTGPLWVWASPSTSTWKLSGLGLSSSDAVTMALKDVPGVQTIRLNRTTGDLAVTGTDLNKQEIAEALAGIKGLKAAVTVSAKK